MAFISRLPKRGKYFSLLFILLLSSLSSMKSAHLALLLLLYSPGLSIFHRADEHNGKHTITPAVSYYWLRPKLFTLTGTIEKKRERKERESKRGRERRRFTPSDLRKHPLNGTLTRYGRHEISFCRNVCAVSPPRVNGRPFAFGRKKIQQVVHPFFTSHFAVN